MDSNKIHEAVSGFFKRVPTWFREAKRQSSQMVEKHKAYFEKAFFESDEQSVILTFQLIFSLL